MLSSGGEGDLQSGRLDNKYLEGKWSVLHRSFERDAFVPRITRITIFQSAVAVLWSRGWGGRGGAITLWPSQVTDCSSVAVQQNRIVKGQSDRTCVHGIKWPIICTNQYHHHSRHHHHHHHHHRSIKLACRISEASRTGCISTNKCVKRMAKQGSFSVLSFVRSWNLVKMAQWWRR